MKNFRSFQVAGIDQVRFSTSKCRCDRDMVAFQEYTYAEMVSVKRVAPSVQDRWRSEQEKIVRVLIHNVRYSAEFTEEVIDLHCRYGFLEAFRRERSFQKGEN